MFPAPLATALLIAALSLSVASAPLVVVATLAGLAILIELVLTVAALLETEEQ